jgi:hypothetical protein
MPRSFDMATEYEGSVEQVHRAFADEKYWHARLADSGVDDATLDRLDVENGSIVVHTTQVLRADRLPAIATQFHRGDLRIEREEHWSSVAGGESTATVGGTISGAPVSLDGTAKLIPGASGKGSRLEFKTSVEVRIPLVGGKVEGFIVSQLADLVIAEQRFTTAWIAGGS